MYLWQQQELEDQQREAAYLASIGPIGRIVDNELYFCVTITVLMMAGFLIGFGIGTML